MASPGDRTNARQANEDVETLEQRRINEEYKIWKKNSVFLYDMMFSRALEWPSLSIQWLPDVKRVEGTNMSQHRLLFGTHTSDQAQNHLQIANVEIPDLVEPDTSEFDESRGEIGGHGNAKRPFTFQVIQKINHPGEVNKARYEPTNPNIIASFTVDGDILVFDRTKHSSYPKNDETIQAELKLEGHTSEGYGLSWNPSAEYTLATGGHDGTVKTWDVKAGFEGGAKTIKPLQTFTHHASTVNDVQYHPVQRNWLATVSDDLNFSIVDANSGKVITTKKAHDEAVNCVAWHPHFETIFATGSADKTIAMWDLRNTKNKLHLLQAHQDDVVGLEWHPDNDAVIASSGYDRRLLFWDISKIGEEQTPDEAEDGPPELLFMHGGFTNRITDFNFNKNQPWLICAAAEDNQMQMFRPARSLVNSTGSRDVTHEDISD
ncbi:WD40 repeat-like protein [Pseudovirgaria hyperparasitica]|uniref:WD40 repeat-like protein n=1 Tax=Pseudovirgaria hyperparasitica TaxID=470096 RepID=A0A6A6VUN5_9PEZI|nr:WD40 repeat-like protein [Pseudovirgaria hyperparasitica]KAF2753943.1 WD40 repeat-like protein [Pseudovirgaria hyperparasitica]